MTCLVRAFMTMLGLLAVVGFANEGTDEWDKPVPYQSWETGRLLPRELLHFRGSDLVSIPSDTSVVYRKITNEPLLWELILADDMDARTFEFAVVQALHVIGPDRFFAGFKKLCHENPSLLAERRFQQLRTRMEQELVTVDSLGIRDQYMSGDERNKVFQAMIAELNTGMAFPDLYRKYARMHEYIRDETLPEGRVVHLRRTQITSSGPAVVTATRHDDWPFRELWKIPDDHVPPLLAAAPGQCLLLRDEIEKTTILYQIKGKHAPNRNSEAGNATAEPKEKPQRPESVEPQAKSPEAPRI